MGMGVEERRGRITPTSHLRGMPAHPHISMHCCTMHRTIRYSGGVDISKNLVAASASPLVLGILAEGDSYGYAIIQRVAELSNQQLQWSEGLLYPLLHRLERQTHIESYWGTSETGRRRKYYRLTERGRAAADEHRSQWSTVHDALSDLWGRDHITKFSYAQMGARA